MSGNGWRELRAAWTKGYIIQGKIVATATRRIVYDAQYNISTGRGCCKKEPELCPHRSVKWRYIATVVSLQNHPICSFNCKRKVGLGRVTVARGRQNYIHDPGGKLVGTVSTKPPNGIHIKCTWLNRGIYEHKITIAIARMITGQTMPGVAKATATVASNRVEAVIRAIICYILITGSRRSQRGAGIAA